VSNNSKGSSKSQGPPRPAVKPEVKQPSNLMPRTASKQVKDQKMTPFHKVTLDSAGGLDTPGKGSNTGGWTLSGSRRQTTDICQNMTPKALGNMLGIRNPTPPNSDSDSKSSGSNNSNQFAASSRKPIQPNGYQRLHIDVCDTTSETLHSPMCDIFSGNAVQCINIGVRRWGASLNTVIQQCHIGLKKTKELFTPNRRTIHCRKTREKKCKRMCSNAH